MGCVSWYHAAQQAPADDAIRANNKQDAGENLIVGRTVQYKREITMVPTQAARQKLQAHNSQEGQGKRDSRPSVAVNLVVHVLGPSLPNHPLSGCPSLGDAVLPWLIQAIPFPRQQL